MMRWISMSSKAGPRRRRVVPLWRSRKIVIITLLLSGFALAGLGYWSWHAQFPQRLATAGQSWLIAESADLGFRVREVFVIGRKRTPRDRLVTALGVDRGAPILAIDLHQARGRILALPWVRDATIERLLPDTVVVRLAEREAVALWQRRGLYSLIDERGEPFTADDLAAFAHLLIVVGDNAPAHVPALLRMLEAEQDLKDRVKAAVRIGNRRWNLHFDGEVEVRLPEMDAAAAWSRLAGYQRSQRLLDKGLQTIDLRFADRLIVRRATQGGTKPREGGNHA